MSTATDRRQLPETLRQMLDAEDGVRVLFPGNAKPLILWVEPGAEVSRRESPLAIHLTVHAPRSWARWRAALAVFVPSEQQLRRAAAFLIRAGRMTDKTLKIAVILIGIYLALEIGSAFLPNGAVARILGGGQ